MPKFKHNAVAAAVVMAGVTPIRADHKFYDIKNAAEDCADIYIYDYIGGWDIYAQKFVDEINAITASEINVHINSPGGSMVEAAGIAAAMHHHKAKINVMIDGLAASAASMIAMAGDTVSMAANGLIMIHNPSSGVYGMAEDMRKEADVLDKFKKTAVAAYRWKVELSEDELNTMMDEETWLSAEEALEMGFIDNIAEPAKAAARFAGPMNTGEVPEKYRAQLAELVELEAPADEPEADENAPALAAGQFLAFTLGTVINGRVTDDKDSEAVIAELAQSADIEPETLASLVSGETTCPHRNVLVAIANAAESSIETLVAASRADGCEYDAEGNAQVGTERASAERVLQACAEANLDGFATHFNSLALTEFDLGQRIENAREVTDICAAADMPNVSAKLIKANVCASAVSDILTDLRAALSDENEVDPTQPKGPASKGGTLNVVNFYGKQRSAARR